MLIRVNPLVLVAIGLLALPGSFAVRTVPIGLLTLATYALAGVALRVSWRVVWARGIVVLIAAASVVWSTWLLGGHQLDTATTAGLRILVLAIPGAVLAAYVDPARLADQLGQRLHLPARFVVALSAALQRFEQLSDTWTQLARARRIRGMGPGRGPVAVTRHASSMTFGLLVSAMRNTTQLSIAMDARGFGSARTRTWAEPAPWTPTDTALLALGIALAAVPVAAWLAGA